MKTFGIVALAVMFTLMFSNHVLGVVYEIDLPEVVNQVGIGSYSFEILDPYLTEFQTIDSVSLKGTGYGSTSWEHYEEIWDWVYVGMGQYEWMLINVIHWIDPGGVQLSFSLATDEVSGQILSGAMGTFDFIIPFELNSGTWASLSNGIAYLDMTIQPDLPDYQNFYFDTCSLVVEGTVPEPASAAILLAGAVWMAVKRRR